MRPRAPRCWRRSSRRRVLVRTSRRPKWSSPVVVALAVPKGSRWWRAWPTPWAVLLAPPGQLPTRAGTRTRAKWARPARPSPRSSTLQWVSPVAPRAAGPRRGGGRLGPFLGCSLAGASFQRGGGVARERLGSQTMVYLDHAASTPMLPEAVAAMAELLGQVGNASSLHATGRRARRIVEESRERLAQSVGRRPSEVIFTGGGTEADNLAVKGLFWSRRAADTRRR